MGGASDGSSGRVETCLGGIWGTVCSNGWDDTDAQSICKSLGFNYGSKNSRHQYCVFS